MNKRKSIDTAKALTKEGKAQEAAKIFNEVLEKYPTEINEWDTFFLIQCQRAGGNINKLEEWVEKQKDFDKVQNIYSWYLYDLHVKKFEAKNIYEHEKGIRKLIDYSQQKDYSIKGVDDIPCPYTMGVLKLIKAYRKPNINIIKVSEWIDKLDPSKLSKQSSIFTNQKGKETRIASPYEDYYAIKSSLKLKEEKFEECIELSDIGLSTIKYFHYDNDIWFTRRKALSLIKLGKEDEGFKLLISLSKNRKGDKWFLYHEIAEVYFKNEDYEPALKYCAKGIKSFGDETFKVKLLILTARILFKLKRMDNAVILANYMAGINMVHKLEKDELKKIIEYFKIDISTIKDPKKHLSEYRIKVNKILGIKRNRDKKKNRSNKQIEIKAGEEVKGWIKTIHGNGKSGHVIVDKEAYFFSMRDTKVDIDKLEHGVSVMLGFKDAKDKDGNPTKHGIITKILNS